MLQQDLFSRWDELQVVRFFLVVSYVSISSESLQNSLNGTQFHELLAQGNSMRHIQSVLQQGGAQLHAEIYVWVIEQRGDIVLRKTEPHSLKIDEIGLAVTQENVLTLTVAMNGVARQRGEKRDDFFAGSSLEEALCEIRAIAVLSEEILSEIFVLPVVERCIKCRLQRPGRLRAVQGIQTRQDLLIGKAQGGVSFLSQDQQSTIPEILHGADAATFL